MAGHEQHAPVDSLSEVAALAEIQSFAEEAAVAAPEKCSAQANLHITWLRNQHLPDKAILSTREALEGKRTPRGSYLGIVPVKGATWPCSLAHFHERSGLYHLV